MSTAYSTTGAQDKQRHKRANPCPICQGYDDRRLGDDRCYGFTSGEWVHCTNPRFAGDAKFNEKTNAWVHFIGERQQAKTSSSSQARQRTFEYRDLDNTLRYRTVRIDKPEPDGKGKDHTKIIWQEAYDGNGGWIKSMQGVERFPYRIPDLARYPDAVVYIVEGEPKVEALRQWGLIAICNTEGAKKWDGPNHKDSPYLKGRQVVILPDNDQTGQQHAQDVARKLQGIAASIKVVTLPDLPPKGDIVDWIADGHTKEELLALVDQAKGWEPGEEETEDESLTPEETLAYWASQGFKIESTRELLNEDIPPIRWVIPDLLAEGLTVLGAKSKVGKSWFALALCEASASGGLALQHYRVEKGMTLYLALEENKRRMKSRLERLQANTGSAFDYTLKCPPLDNGGLKWIRAWIQTHPDARLIVIDTLTAVRKRTKGQGRLHDEDYDSLLALQRLANEQRVAILMIHHCKKAPEADPFDELSGTQGINACADNMIVIRREPESTEGVMYFRGRDVDHDPIQLEWDKATCHWKYAGDAEIMKVSARQREIIAALKAAGKPMMPKEVAEALGMDVEKQSNNVRQLLNTMKGKGLVIRVGEGFTIPTKRNHNGHNTDNNHNDHNKHNAAEEEEGVRENDSSVNERYERYESESEDITATPPDTDSPEGPSVMNVMDDSHDDDSDELTDTGKQRLIDLQQELARRKATLPPMQRNCYRCHQYAWRWDDAGQRWVCGNCGPS